MDDYESLSHTKWECKYHVVFIPKYRRKTLYGELRRHLGEVFRKLAVQKECRIEEGRGRVSDPQRPLRAATSLKPPALPGDIYRSGEPRIRSELSNIESRRIAYVTSIVVDCSLDTGMS